MKTRKAYITKKDGTKYWFDIPIDTAEKVLRLQKMFREEQKRKQKKLKEKVFKILEQK